MTELASLLEERRIRKIVCIDDENAPPRIESLEDAANAIARNPPRRIRLFAQQDPRFEKLSALRASLVSEESDEVRARLGPLLQELADEHKLQGKDLEALGRHMYQGYVGDTTKRLRAPFQGQQLEPLSFREWQERATEIVAHATQENRVLLLVDEINERERDIDLNGVKLLSSLWRNHVTSVQFIDVIVLTSNCSPEQEFEEARSLLESVRDDLKDPELSREVARAFVISKDRLDRDPLEAHFVVHLTRMKAAQLRWELVTLTTKALDDANKESLTWLEQIPLSAFQGSVFASSESEGAAEIETLLRLVGIRQRAGLEKKLKSDGELRAKIAEMRAFSLKRLDAAHVTASQPDLQTLRKLEFERAGDHVNSLFAPIACGDVFTFRAEKFETSAMLLANPCDLALRSDGSRKLRRGWLVKVLSDTKGALVEIERKRGGLAPLSYMLTTGSREEDAAYLFNNSNVESVDLSILDFCWTNADGRVELKPPTAKEAFDFVLPSQRKRLQFLAKVANSGKLGVIELWGTEFKPAVGDVGKDVEHAMDGISLERSICFDVARVWRLAPDFAAAVLAALAQSIARPAFGHDFRSN